MVQDQEPAETSLLRQAESSGHLTIQTEYKKGVIEEPEVPEVEEEDDFGVL